MNKSIIAIALLSATGLAQAGESVDKRLDAKADGLVEIENVRGRIEVVAWDKNEVAVKGSLDDETERFIFESEGASTRIVVETRARLRSGEGSNLVIHLPKGSRVHANLVSADLVLKGVLGGTEAKTVSGDIKASGLKRRMELGSVSGKLTISDSEGEAELSTVSGDIQAEVDAESVSLNTVSGEARFASDTKLKELTLNTVSGDAEVRAKLADDAQVEGSTVSGDLRLYVNKDVNAVLDLHTAAGGEVVNGLSGHKPSRGMIGNEELRVTLGEGKGNIELGSVSGTLELQPL